MNIVLFTPTVKKSAIARMAHLISHELFAQGHAITIIQTEAKHLFGTDTFNFGTPIIHWTNTDQVTEAVALADACIYQIGNCYEFHQGGLHWLPQYPGIVCLHDFFLGGIFLEWAKSDYTQAKLILHQWYEPIIANQFFTLTCPEPFTEKTRNTAPMIEWIASMALGVITHSNWGCDRIMRACPGPIRTVPLPYNAPGIALTLQKKASTFQNKFQILTIGHVNTNKRIDSVIQAIGENADLRQHTIYRLVGEIKPAIANKLSTLAQKYNVNLIISGEVEDTVLAQAITDSDVICCLRWPSLKAASASAIEAMLYGAAIIVTNTGFYKEIPNTCALKINPDNEIADLSAALDLLFKNPAQRKAMGIQAQQWAEKTFTSQNYVENIIDLIEITMKTQVSLNAIHYFCNIMHQWSTTSDFLNQENIIHPLNLFNLKNT
ncbi:MAG: glycosyltransferase family 4 protein [Legionellaceae bacterium]|nr:glycosyltransferase family 4 protein [Legionellaceae bacterium]